MVDTTNTPPTVAAFLASLPDPLSRRGKEWASSKEIVGRIRKELAAATVAGVFPEGAEFSVRQNRGGHTLSITVEIVRWHGPVFCEDYIAACLQAYATGQEPRWDAPLGRSRGRYSEAFAAGLEAAKRIADRHNYDNSRIEVDYFEVGYYLSVTADRVESDADTGLRCEADPSFVALRERAFEAAKVLPPNLVKYHCGSAGLERAGKWALSRVVEWAERAAGRPVKHIRGRWTIVSQAAQAGAAA